MSDDRANDAMFLRLTFPAGPPERVYNKALRPHDLCFREWVTLYVLRELGAAPQREVVRQVGLDKVAVYRACKELMRQSLIEAASPCEDARLRRLRVTRQGLERLDRTMPAIDHARELLFGSLPETNVAAFVATLHRVEVAAMRAGAKPGVSCDPEYASQVDRAGRQGPVVRRDRSMNIASVVRAPHAV
ncbi:MarR family winged helix-turn-helix transcriptional regulator [Sphingomonas sp. MG17]|uniref:MarR family winged helix-turn-helix transcriptional regulator n=2 Tax=Sphingomonas tagetis TaxID=2949092 RepID=A0A9X2HKS2_9SPHN|nr:MarR family winged helix-turn-helix transcriptional regulator [Sphingomonas tagetis]